MRATGVVRAVFGLATVLLVLGLLVAPAEATTRQASPPATILPPVPSQLDPLTSAVSPVVWQACHSVGLVVGLTVVAGTLIGVPPDVGVPLNAAIATATGPVLSVFFEACQQIPLPDDPPDCATDAQIPPLPSLGRPILLAGLLANELRALDTAFAAAGVPLQGALGKAADDLLASANGQNPPPDATVPGPGIDDGVTPGLPAVTDDGSSDGGPATTLGLPATSGGPTGAGAAARVEKPVAIVPTASTRGTGRGVAVALLALAALAAFGWAHAGSSRSRSGRDVPGDAP